jgi:hypothetical protein
MPTFCPDLENSSKRRSYASYDGDCLIDDIYFENSIFESDDYLYCFAGSRCYAGTYVFGDVINSVLFVLEVYRTYQDFTRTKKRIKPSVQAILACTRDRRLLRSDQAGE